MKISIKPDKILKFNFISRNDLYDDKWIHWSRKYEYPICLDFIKKINPSSIHNTSCGGLNTKDCLHLSFCNEISKICESTIHSDIWSTNGAPKKPEENFFKFYDITKPYNSDKKFDMVINISTLEELDSGIRDSAFINLYNQVKDGGILFLTFDYPHVDINWIENIVGEKVKQKYWSRIYNWQKKISVILLVIKK